MYFTPKKIKIRFPSEKISEHSIFIPQTLDSLNLPIRHGLQDTNLGPQASERTCTSCNSSYFNCPGHFGSIDFHTMILNPLLFRNLYLILTSSCHICLQFKLTEFDRETYIKNDKDNLFELLRESARERCNICKVKRHTKKLNLKVIFGDQYVQPSKIFHIIKKLAEKEKDIFEFLGIDFRSFFLHRLFVIPNKFRPLNVLDDQIFESAHNIHLTKIIKINNLLRNEIEFLINQKEPEKKDASLKKGDNQEIRTEKITIETYFSSQSTHLNEDNGVNPEIDTNLNTLLDNITPKSLSKINGIISALQSSVQHYFDSTDYPAKIQPPGVKQILEKKEGLFRQHMMGKRVNFTARTVISPDPYIRTDEIGIPVKIAQKLTFPERVTPINRRRLEKCVQNGTVYPGAEFIIEKGIKRSIRFIKNKKAVSRTLLKNNSVVYRHMQENDYVLVNRQPTLHKPSLMSHKVKILNDKTIRLHYVNCNSYNADFDGDEMNIHLPQNYRAMSESALSSTDQNYLLNGKPMRGLVQDYITSIFIITLKNSFFTKQEFFDLLITSEKKTFKLPSPALYRPKRMYTGKQLIQSLLSCFGNVSYKNKNKIPQSYWVSNLKESEIFTNISDTLESTVLFKNGIFIHGTLDKSQVGTASHNLIHSFFNFKDIHLPNDILTALSRMISRYLIGWGVALTIDDLILRNETEQKRTNFINEGIASGNNLTYETIGIKKVLNNQENREIIEQNNLKQKNTKLAINTYLSQSEHAEISNTIKSHVHNTTSSISNILIRGTAVPFPFNNMSNIILSGGKGSIVNFSQISGILNQQSLEGKRVPLQKNGRALSYFTTIGVIENGFITNRFLTGLKVHDFFFHCQAGREGLIDTAVKTARSGYLQRCIVKMLEHARVEYDGSVRDNNLLQYTYGQDGKDPIYSESVEDPRIHPGESVGILAAQAVGEPSTQMTLNTFHLAGCSTNVTLGMPRLKEILMVGSKSTNNILIAKLNPDFKDTSFIKTKILRPQQQMKDILYYSKVIQSNYTNLIFVFNRSLNIHERIKIRKWLAKEIVKHTEFPVNAIDLNQDENINELDCETFEELESKLKEPDSDELAYFDPNSINDNFISTQQLNYQIKNNLFSNENVISLKFNSTFAVDYIINKMRETFLLIKSNIKNVEIENEEIRIEGSDFESVIDCLLSVDHQKKEGTTENTSFTPINHFIDIHTLESSDIVDTFNTFGIEAARTVIVNEIKKVFKAYGIEINIRHLLLITDKMTHTGEYCAFNRHKMMGSILSKMSFECTFNFLRTAYLFKEKDDLMEPSARLVMGMRIKNGTGMFDILNEEKEVLVE